MNSMTQINDNINFGALLTFDEVKQLDSKFGVMQRIALLPLTRSYKQLVDASLKDEAGGEAFVTVFETTDQYIQFLKDMLELAEQSAARLAVVGEACLKQWEPNK